MAWRVCLVDFSLSQPRVTARAHDGFSARNLRAQMSSNIDVS